MKTLVFEYDEKSRSAKAFITVLNQVPWAHVKKNPNAKLKKAMQEAAEGKLTDFKNSKDMHKKMGL